MVKELFEKKDVFIIIAAYNEGNSIKKVVNDLIKAGYSNIVVTDDGSKDNTFAVISKLPIYSLQHKVNKGQGAALRTGMNFAIKKKAKYLVHFDADGQHRIADLKSMINPVASGKYEMTIGSRFLGKDKPKLPIKVWFRLKVGIIVQWVFYGLLLSDAHNGFRCISQSAVKKINFKSNRMEHASEIVELMKNNKVNFKEIPIKVIYTDEIMAHGHGSFFGGVKVFIEMLKHKLGFKRY